MLENRTRSDQAKRYQKPLWYYGVVGLAGLAVAKLMGVTAFLPEEGLVVMEKDGPRATTWPMGDAQAHGLNEGALVELASLVGGSGFVAHRGIGVYRWGFDHRPRYAASVKKSLISVMMLQAVEAGLIGGIDEAVVRFEPRLAGLNGGVDAGITWRHLANMTSGYGMADRPGEAFAYNDYAVALWYDTLMDKVYREKGTAVLRRQLAEPLGFEDEVTFQAFGPKGPEPKLRISARDLARFGQLLMDRGMVRGRRLLSEQSMKTMIGSVVPWETPLSTGEPAEMISGQKSVGGTWNISPIGPGRYSFHLWVNRAADGEKLMLADAPEDTLLASGKWGETTLWVIPSLELVVAWNGSAIDDHHLGHGDREAEMNVAARLMVKAVREPDLVALAD
jgi:CubicO group peptidase (beta-lactamase class C family)